MVNTIASLPPLLSRVQHAVVFHRLPLPTPNKFFDAQKAHWLALRIGSAAEYERLRQFLPDNLNFVLRPAQPNPLDFHRRMAQMVEVDGERGRSWIFAAEMIDEIAMPMEAHLMVGVDGGERRSAGRPSLFQADIVAEKRSPLNVWDGVCYASLFPQALKGRDHGFCLVASRDAALRWPCIYLAAGQPTLFAYSVPNREWDVPSCRERRGL